MSTTQRVVRKQLAGAEDLLQGVGTVTQTRGTGTYPIHKLDIPIPTYDIAEMQASSAEFMRLYGSDTVYTDYRRNPEGTIGIPSNLGGVWEPMRSSELLVCGNFATGAYVFSSDCIVALDQQLYNWSGAFPKVVTAGATPATSGGIGAGAWVDRTAVTLKSELNAAVSNSVKYLSSYAAVYANQTEALQAALDELFPKYGSYYNVNALGSGKKLIIDGDYSVAEIDLSYRNYVNIEQTGTLTYSGSVVDGVWIEAKGSSYTKWKCCKLNGADKVGSFIHQSGDGYSSGDSGSHDALTGKGNVTGLDYYRLEMTGQYPGSTKPQFDTIPYISDTTNSYYYSVDDSIFYKPAWKTYSLDGFCLSIGSSAITLIKPILANMNGIKLHPSASYTAFGPVWSLRGGSYGANYAVTNADVGQIDLFGPYLEETPNLFKHAGGTSLARLRHLNVYGGIYAGKSTATRVIDIPTGVEGSIRIDGMRVQEIYGRKIYAPSCSLSLMDYSNSNTTTNQRSYGFQIESVGMLSSEIMSDLGIFSGGCNTNVNANLYVNGNSNSYLGEFPDLDSAINYAVASKAQKVTINVYQDVTINQQHNFSGYIEIKGVTSQRGLVINVMPYIVTGSSLTIGELITVNNPTSGITRLIRNNGGTFEFKGRINFNDGTALVEHYKGESMFNNATQFYGQFIDASYSYATGRIMFKSMTWGTNAIAILGGMASCEIHSSALPASTVNIPAGTKWLTTVAANADCVYQMVTVGGPNPTWKKFGAIV